ncbi:hypothetical protein OUZ56_026450 [Daphnia magna]|uniref:Uncharacterized protein n=1 Tax=Daphnia magna TaxID=35525 RepID=A0ABQ9ZM66_9CRUS|nr:hypothetical protein OUZ56_026450 [Daphnia magna]
MYLSVEVGVPTPNMLKVAYDYLLKKSTLNVNILTTPPYIVVAVSVSYTISLFCKVVNGILRQGDQSSLV